MYVSVAHIHVGRALHDKICMVKISNFTVKTTRKDYIAAERTKYER